MIRDGVIYCLGEPLLRLSSPVGTPLSHATNLDLHVGGAEVNVAVALSCLGHSVEMLGAVPDGPLGEMVLAHLRRHGVGTAGLVRRAGRLGTYYLDRGGPGRPAAVVYDRAGSVFAMLEHASLPFMPDNGTHLHLSGILPALGDDTATLAAAALTAARQQGLTASFDINFRSALWATGRRPEAVLRPLIEDADILFAGARDATLLLARPVADADAGPALLEVLPRLKLVAALDRQVVSHRHHRLTARIWMRAGDTSVVTGETPDVVDRIGSGDAFVAGVLDALRRGDGADGIAEAGLAMALMKLGVDGDAAGFSRADLAAARAGAGDVRR